MNTINLNTITPELFKRLRQGSDRNPNSVIDDYFDELAKKEEMASSPIDQSWYLILKDITEREVLPLYMTYTKRREEIEKKQNKRSPWKYVIATIAALEVLEIAISKGRALAPQILLPSIGIEAALGGLLYMCAKTKDEWQLDNAKNRFLNGVQGLDEKLKVDEQYEEYKNQQGAGEVLRAEAFEIVSKYDRPGDFWRDYINLRRIDPTTKNDMHSLSLSIFKEFIQPHIEGKCNEQVRNYRFNRLFLFAHEAFMKRDERCYVSTNLEHLASSNIEEETTNG